MRNCALLVLLVVMGCGGESDLKSTETSPSISGTWKSQCLQDSAGFFKVVVIFGDSAFRTSTESYATAKCTDANFRTTIDNHGTYELQEFDSRSGTTQGARLFTWKYDGREAYDIILVRDKELRFGDADSISNAEDRPLKLSSTIYAKE